MFNSWQTYLIHLHTLEQQGLVTRTFRRLDGERQKAILDAILLEAAEKGPAAINIKAVAEKAGVSVGSLYQYFPDRERMLAFAVALCRRYLEDLFALSAPYLLDMPLRDGLQAYLSYGVEWGQTETGLVRFFGRAAYQGDPDLNRELVTPVAQSMRNLIERMLADAQARGELRPDLDLPAAARLVHALTVALGDSQLLPYLDSYFQVSTDQMPFERVVEVLLVVLENGMFIKPGTGTGSGGGSTSAPASLDENDTTKGEQTYG